MSGGAAQKAGMKEGDIIQGINGLEVKDSRLICPRFIPKSRAFALMMPAVTVEVRL